MSGANNTSSGVKALLRSIAPMTAVMVITVLSSGSAEAGPAMIVEQNMTLADDFHGSIIIVKDNVTLDCAGYGVIGEGHGRGVIVGGLSGVTIKNCHVSNFATGFWISGSSGNSFENNSSFGHRLANDNSPAGWISGAGFWIQSSPSNVFRRNTSRDNPSDGFDVFNSPGNSFVENHVHGNALAGFFADGRSTGLNFSANRSEQNGYGFIFDGGHSHVLVENSADLNSQIGFYLLSTQGSTLSRNSSTHSGIGFFLSSDASGNLLDGNYACFSVNVDIEVDSTSINNTFVNNQFCVASGL